ncbi:MAG TPA: type III secretion protein [Alphaproteobacteria bacterium]|nr:type III secretion protein [Alphaproteobacteria bacterium]
MRLQRLERQEPWADEPYPYIVLDQELEDVLREFGSNVGVPVKVSSRVKGKVRGRWPSLTPGQFLDRLATAYGLQWYYDGQTLHVTTTGEAISEMLPLGPVRFYELYRELKNLKVADPRFPIRAASQANIALISGPPRFVSAVRETLGALQQAYRFETTIVRGRTQERPTL